MDAVGKNFGYFDDAAFEYVITDPRTPAKWINYVGTLKFGGIIDQTGGMLLCKGDPALSRITKYIPQMPCSDFKGSTLYLRLKTAAGYEILSPFFVPGLHKLDRYECHVGLGYQRIISEIKGIRTECTFFVPNGEERLLWDIRVTNISHPACEIDIVPVIEYTHYNAIMQLNNADWVPQTMQSRVTHQDKGLLILRQYPFMFRDFKINWMTSNKKVSSFQSDRKRFLGDNEYGTWAKPLSLLEPELDNYEAHRGDNIGALLHPMGTVVTGQSVRLIVQMGQDEKVENAFAGIEKFRQESEVDAAFHALKDYWQDYLSVLQSKTPDAAFARMVNIHNPRQCHTTKNWSRDLSLYQLGFGGRGMGVRDSSQDVMGILPQMAEEGRELIEKILAVQVRNGSAMHQFYASTGEATKGECHEGSPQYYSDDHLWIVLAVCAYLKESGNLSFLDKMIPYYDKDKAGQAIEVASVFDHLKRAVAYTHGDLGKHGLPLLGFADWNDTVNLKTGAESLFTANLYGKALKELEELAIQLKDTELTTQCQNWHAEMKKTVNEVAWDGEWWTRYFDHDGTPLGSHTCSHGKIYANGQSWPVISGFAEGERATQALESVNKHLNTSSGIKLSGPGFNGFDPTKGGITTYPPGAKENGGIFLHANPWVMIAEAILGNGDRAFQYYQQINPAAKNDCMDVFEVEPYCYPQNILGDEHPQFGLGRNSWLSGTSSWTYQAATQYILGVRTSYTGLLIDPCIPKSWKEFQVTRKYRGATYHIQVANPMGLCKGVKSITVGGVNVVGNTIPLSKAGAEVKVEVVMG